MRINKLFLLVFLTVGLITAFLDQFALLHWIETLPNVCPLKRYTGLQCAFCGMTHAWIYFWHGDWSSAFHENCLSLALFVGTPLVVASTIWTRFWAENRVKIAVWIALFLLVAYTVLRNLNF